MQECFSLKVNIHATNLYNLNYYYSSINIFNFVVYHRNQKGASSDSSVSYDISLQAYSEAIRLHNLLILVTDVVMM